MRGDQLSRQWRVIRAIEASPNGLTVAEIAKREEIGIRTISRDLEALQPKRHAKAQSTPREIFTPLFFFLDIFLTPGHTALGPGLLESVYETVLAYELGKRDLQVEHQKPLPVVYENVRLEEGFRADLIISDLTDPGHDVIGA